MDYYLTSMTVYEKKKNSNNNTNSNNNDNHNDDNDNDNSDYKNMRTYIQYLEKNNNIF